MTTAPEPAWLVRARALIGTREAAGPANNPTIMGWAKRLGAKVLGIVYNADSVPWCGLFVAWVMSEAGIKPAPIAVRASAWSSWGQPMPKTALAPGAVLVFQRPGGGHVGLYVGEDLTHYHVLGGNQGDSVNISRLEKSRLVAARWPAGVPMTGRPVLLSAKGASASTNEA